MINTANPLADYQQCYVICMWTKMQVSLWMSHEWDLLVAYITSSRIWGFPNLRMKFSIVTIQSPFQENRVRWSMISTRSVHQLTESLGPRVYQSIASFKYTWQKWMNIQPIVVHKTIFQLLGFNPELPLQISSYQLRHQYVHITGLGNRK